LQKSALPLTIKKDCMNEITLEQINHLSDIQLSQLLHKVIGLEAVKYKLEDWDRSVPFNITTADAGSDGRIQWNGTPASSKWIKNSFTIFQNKATNLFPRDCGEEILQTPVKGEKTRKLKAQIEKLVSANGCYVLFTNKPIVDHGRDNREKAFRKAIEQAGHANHDTFEILIYDSNDIKDWTNEYIAAVTLVQAFNNIDRPFGFSVWDKWATLHRANENAFQIDDKIETNLKLIRESINSEKVIRVTGHSGLGKTRLVLESFRDNDLTNSVVYYDLEGSENIAELKGYILSHQDTQDGIIVIDNCDVRSHLILSAITKPMGDLKIITVGLDDSNSIQDLKIKIERNEQRLVVKEIVQAKIGKTHQPSDIEYINTISEGYPWMAIRFCNIVLNEGMSELNKIPLNEFIRKLIFGLNPENEIEYDVIRACSVFSAFGFLDDSFRDIINDELKETLKAQMDFIRTTIFDGEITETKFKTICNKFRNEDILEKKGIYYIVKPTVLAINLASNWLINTDSDRIIKIIQELKQVKLEEKFVERLKDLDQIDKAKDIVAELWGANSPFGIAEVLNTSWGSLLFRYVVEVNPIATVRTLEEAFGGKSKEELILIDQGRRNLVWALEKLCFRNETFIPAAKVLYSFAVAENEDWGNNSTNQFKQLFQLFLSGTEANLEKRLKIIKWGLSKNDNDYTKIGVEALGRGLINDNYSRMGGADKQGSGAPLKDYQPNWDEISNYWKECIEILTEIACSEDENSSLAKTKIANSLRTLIRDNELEVLDSVSKIIENTGNLWTEALSNLKLTLTYEKRLSEDIIQRINRLIIDLTPTDIKNQLFLKVTQPEWDTSEKDDEGYYIDKPQLNAESLAEKIVNEDIDLKPFISDLLVGEQRQAVSFGKRIGELASNPSDLINFTLNELRKREKEKQNPEFIGGLLLGTKEKIDSNKVIDELIKDIELQQHVFYFVRLLHPTYENLIKLFSLIDDFGFPINQFQNFRYGRALDKLSNDELIKLCHKISKYSNAGKWTALSLIFMYCYNNQERFIYSIGYLKQIISESNLLINNDNSYRLDGHHWSVTVEKILDENTEKEFAIAISQQLIEFCGEEYFNYSLESYLYKVLSILFERYFYVVWETIGNGIIGDYLNYFHLKNMIGTKNGYMNSTEGIAFMNPDYFEHLIAWCKQHKDVAPQRIANMMPLSVKIMDKETWHPFSRMVIDGFGDDERVLENLSSNMGTFGSIGSSVPYYQTQKTILLELVNHEKEKVQNWAIKMIDYTDRVIRREQLNDEQMYL
jgi:hypothetical protein